MSWQILTTLESLPGQYTPPFDAASLLSGPVASRTVAAIADKTLRERALAIVRSAHPDWPRVYSEIFFLNEEPRILSVVMSELEKAGQNEIRDRLIDETLRYPRRHPRAFYWYVKQIDELDTLPERANYGLIFQILEAIASDEFAAVRARLKDFFDKGALVIRIIMNTDNEEQARKLVESLERYGGVEEYRREDVKHALLMKYASVSLDIVRAIGFAVSTSIRRIDPGQ